jgi:hypothetical protein
MTVLPCASAPANPCRAAGVCLFRWRYEECRGPNRRLDPARTRAKCARCAATSPASPIWLSKRIGYAAAKSAACRVRAARWCYWLWRLGRSAGGPRAHGIGREAPAQVMADMPAACSSCVASGEKTMTAGGGAPVRSCAWHTWHVVPALCASKSTSCAAPTICHDTNSNAKAASSRSLALRSRLCRCSRIAAGRWTSRPL